MPPGKSPMDDVKKDGAIVKMMLKMMLTEKSEWSYLKDEEGWTPFCYAASMGFLEGVLYLLNECPSCALERDNKGRNIFHIAARSGQLNVVRYILQDSKLKKMINEKDVDGNTALHLATIQCHPRIVHTLTWNKEVVELDLVNKKNQTAIDLAMQNSVTNKNLTLKQQLTWSALKSAGAQRAQDFIKVPSQDEDSKKNKASNSDMQQFKNRKNTLMMVSTVLSIAALAASFARPGGNNNSKRGMALMLNRIFFLLFKFCISISMHGAIIVIVILIFARAGDLTSMQLALDRAESLLGIIFTTLFLAITAGVYLVSKLTWLHVLSFIFVIVMMLFYVLLWLPSSSSFPVIRYMSYYPFHLLAWMVDHEREARWFKYSFMRRFNCSV